jgi:hypothetical protein
VTDQLFARDTRQFQRVLEVFDFVTIFAQAAGLEPCAHLAREVDLFFMREEPVTTDIAKIAIYGIAGGLIDQLRGFIDHFSDFSVGSQPLELVCILNGSLGHETPSFLRLHPCTHAISALDPHRGRNLVSVSAGYHYVNSIRSSLWSFSQTRILA